MKAENTEYIKKTMILNAAVKSLTGVQHDALYILCKYRHQLHSKKDAVATGREGAKKLENFFRYAMPIMLHTVSLPELDVSSEFDALKSYDINSGKKYTGIIRNALLEEINLKIEDYLRRIDYRNGTSYAPSGFARVTQGACKDAA